jgi:hypothetical protein
LADLDQKVGHVKWLIVLILFLVFFVSAKAPCTVTDFYALSWLGNPLERHQRLSEWLTKNGDNCSSEQLAGIWNNLAAWAGTADSGELRSKVLFYYAKAVEREKK